MSKIEPVTWWVKFHHWRPRWAYTHPYKPRVLFHWYIGRLDDFATLPPTVLSLRLRLWLWHSFMLNVRLPAWVDRRKYPQ